MSKKYVAGRNSKTGQPVSGVASRSATTQATRTVGRFTIGPAGMSKLNAIEGIKQSRSSRTMFAEFERNGASAEERRRAIVAKHAKKG